MGNGTSAVRDVLYTSSSLIHRHSHVLRFKGLITSILTNILKAYNLLLTFQNFLDEKKVNLPLNVLKTIYLVVLTKHDFRKLSFCNELIIIL